MKPVFFTSPSEFRAWLKKNHAAQQELWVGFYKKESGKGGLTYPEALDEALCFGWIDGVRKRAGDDAYVQRFTPRKRGSYWSAVNTRRAEALIQKKRMAPPGLKAFEARDKEKTEKYSFERAQSAFTPAQLKAFKANTKAWAFFEAQPPYYRKVCTFWVASAKKEETQERRLATLIERSAAQGRINLLSSKKAD